MAFPTNATGGGTSAQTIAPNLPQHARGISVVFEIDFFDDAPTNSIPAVPANPATDPSWAIVDPSGVEITSGVGAPGASAGRWAATWNVPPDAPLSTQSNKWRIVWNIVTQTNRQLQQTQTFDVVELRTPDTLEDLRSHAYLTYQGNSERLILRLPSRPSTLSVQGFKSTAIANPCPEDTATFAGTLAGAEITEIEEQNLFVYIFDTPALMDLGEYQIVWNYRLTPTSPNETPIQRIFVPPRVFWSLAPSLRVLIDKLQKKQGTVHAYADADVYEYFSQGVGMLNGVTPATNWDLSNFPYNAATVRFLIEAAALHAMNAQQMLSGELQFSFSGQSVTLDMDQQGVYGEIAQRLIDDLTGERPGAWPRTKVDMIRQATPIAHVGGRLMGRYGTNQYTYKVHRNSIGPSSPTIFEGFPGPGVNAGFTLTDIQVYLNLI